MQVRATHIRPTLIGLAVAGLLVAGAAPARAALINASFAGTVAGTIGTSPYSVGNPIAGSFLYDTTAGSYRSFTIGIYSLPAGPFSSFVPAPFTLTYDAQFKATQTNTGNGASANRSLALDLTSDNGFNTSNLLAFVSNPGAYVTDPNDPNGNSTFTYAALTSTGSTQTRVDANLTSFAATVPEPASLSLVLVGALGLLARRRRTT